MKRRVVNIWVIQMHKLLNAIKVKSALLKMLTIINHLQKF